MALVLSHDTTRFVAVLFCIGALLASGCQWSSSRVRTLETQLRDQDARVLELSRSLDDARAELDAASHESRVLRESLTKLAPPPLPEVAENSFRVTEIEIASLLSGGLDRDQAPGDELLTLLVSPRDRSGETLRSDGTLTVEAFDFSQNRTQRLVGRWEFQDRALSDLWHSGVIGRGFRLVEPWDKTPQSDQIVVHVRLVTSDGREFDQTSEFRITPPDSIGSADVISRKEAAIRAKPKPERPWAQEKWVRTRTLAER